MVECLITKKANINQADQDNVNALIVSAQFNHFSILQLLIKNKANINHAESDGTNVLILTAINGKQNNGIDLMEEEKNFPHARTFKFLISNNADVNQTNSANMSP